MSVTVMPPGLPPLAAYLRVSSIAIALYDVLATMPGEYRLYARQASFRRMSKACWLFIGVRYITIAALVTSSVGFFGTGFSPSFCSHFHVVAPVLKLVSTLISQIIVSTRAYAVSRGSKLVLGILTLTFLLTLPPEIMGNVIGRVPLQVKGLDNCTSGNNKQQQFAWLHYLAAMIFDAIAMVITLIYLAPQVKFRRGRSSKRQPGTFASETGGTRGVHSLANLLVKEGILFFVALTSVNVLNLIFFRLPDKNLQSGAATLGQAVTMIFSEKFILNLTEHVYGEPSGLGNISVSRDTKGLSYGRRANFPGSPRTHDAFELSGIHVTTEVQVDSGSMHTSSNREHKLEDPDTPEPSPMSMTREKAKVYWGQAA